MFAEDTAAHALPLRSGRKIMQKNIIKQSIAAVAAVLAMGAAGSSAWAGGLLAVDFDPTDFTTPTGLSNAYWPLLPGGDATVFIYIGETEDGCAFNKITATPGDWKVFVDSEPGYEFYDGFVAQVVLDREWELEDVECDDIVAALDGDPDWEPMEGLGELTFDWYAQDDYDNIWYMGEASRDFGDECPSLLEVPLGTPIDGWGDDELYFECTGGSWEAGQFGQEEGEIVGEAGIVVPSDMPAAGEPLTPGTYWMQEVAENAQDMAKVLRAVAPLDDYEACRKVKEWNPFEHGGSVEHKWYCKDGPGLVLINGVGGGPTEIEELVLVFSP